MTICPATGLNCEELECQLDGCRLAPAEAEEELTMPPEYVPTGSALDDGPVCVRCGCSAFNACPGGCVWATPDLCSRCV